MAAIWTVDGASPVSTPQPLPSETLPDMIWPVIYDDGGGFLSWFLVGLGGLLVALGIGTIVLLLMRRTNEASELQQAFEASAADTVSAVEATVPRATRALEEEIAEVSATLLATVGRMREITIRAEAFEGEVKRLVQQANAARAAASMDEEKAKQISTLLVERTEQRFRTEIEKLTAAHAEQIKKLRDSGNRTAWLTFGVGSVVGFVLNILASLIMA